MSDWRPIETIPLNNDVLVCVTHSIGLDEWETVQWVDAITDIGWCRFPFMVWVPLEPTHWMPLPDPPEQNETRT